MSHLTQALDYAYRAQNWPACRRLLELVREWHMSNTMERVELWFGDCTTILNNGGIKL